MANYRQIHTCIWKDAWFFELDAEAKLLWIYLFSNERANLTGLYDLHKRIIAFETGLELRAINDAFDLFTAAGKAHYEDGWVYIPNLIKYNAGSLNSDKIRTHIVGALAKIPDTPLKARCIDHYNSLVNPEYRIDTLSMGYPTGYAEQEQEQETEQEQEGGKKSGASAIPPDCFPELFDTSISEIKERKHTRAEWQAILASEKDADGRKTLIEWIESKLSGAAHPAIEAYRNEMGHYPRRNQYTEIIESVGDNGKMGVWRDVVKAWRLHGWNPYNVAGMLEAFGSGGVTEKRGASRNEPPARKQRFITVGGEE